ncbi:general transcription factor 3C polypeptide 6 [Mixophyes fleayi]|uniref:general transcription factor 3C polypeptide 6 n=1 Tax=Mixophyes fleayi TaxID=3061075 RepID=UPI003F4DD87B
MTSNSRTNFHLQQTSEEAEGFSEKNDDYDEEEEEQLVLVELTGIIDSDILEKCDNKCKILGINTEKPFLQVDKYVFAGEYEDVLGTCVIFEETPEQGDGENAKPQLKYKCHTVKKLNMTRTFLTEKKEGDEGGGKIEWFHVKDDSSPSWPQMICSFAQEESQSEEEGQGQLDGSTEEIRVVDQSFESEGKQHSGSEKGHSDSERKRRSDSEGKGCPASKGDQQLDLEKIDNDTDKHLSTLEHAICPSEEASSAQPDDNICHDPTL